MNMDSVNKWLMLAANLGVIAGIIFLAIEVNQNTQVAQSSARQEVLNAELWVFEKIIEDPSIKLGDIPFQFKGLNEEQSTKQANLYNAIFRIRENLWLQYLNGVLDETTWLSYRATFVYFLKNNENMRQYWNWLSESGMDRNFVNEIELYIQE